MSCTSHRELERTVAALTRRIMALEAATADDRPCSGCLELTWRISALEERLGPVPVDLTTAPEPMGVDPDDDDPVAALLKEARQVTWDELDVVGAPDDSVDTGNGATLHIQIPGVVGSDNVDSDAAEPHLGTTRGGRDGVDFDAADPHLGTTKGGRDGVDFDAADPHLGTTKGGRDGVDSDAADHSRGVMRGGRSVDFDAVVRDEGTTCKDGGNVDSDTAGRDGAHGDVGKGKRRSLHLIIGDSIAKGLYPAVLPGDQVLNLAVPGNTWPREMDLLDGHLAHWRREAGRRGLVEGATFVWLGGNDTYGRSNQRPDGLNQGAIGHVLRRLQHPVVMAGPTPRLWRDIGSVWEETPAFQADLKLKSLAADYGITFIPYVGRALTVMHNRKHVLLRGVVEHFFADIKGVHLRHTGYKKLLRRLGGVFTD